MTVRPRRVGSFFVSRSCEAAKERAVGEPGDHAAADEGGYGSQTQCRCQGDLMVLFLNKNLADKFCHGILAQERMQVADGLVEPGRIGMTQRQCKTQVSQSLRVCIEETSAVTCLFEILGGGGFITGQTIYVDGGYTAG